MHSDFLQAQKFIYEPSGLSVTNVQIEKESVDYGALDFHLNDRVCKFRVGKVTPKKAGFFVTLWKRIGQGPIMPYEESDPIDFFVFSVHHNEHFGQFFFTKAILVKKGILSIGLKEGKRALRVYPPWVVATNPQAKKTQSWQREYYFDPSNWDPAVIKQKN